MSLAGDSIETEEQAACLRSQPTRGACSLGLVDGVGHLAADMGAVVEAQVGR